MFSFRLHGTYQHNCSSSRKYHPYNNCVEIHNSTLLQYLDQLHDASTTEIKSFIVWYVNSLITTGFIVEFNFSCLTTQNRLYLSLLLCVCLTLALLLIISFNKSLIKEPPPKYSFKMIYKVIKFAIVTKYPRCRSAFTYCEDELPSRIDFGKSKYGGPFTTEQVEDVKTLLRLLPLISIFAMIASIYIYLLQQIFCTFTLKNYTTDSLNGTSLVNQVTEKLLQIVTQKQA